MFKIKKLNNISSIVNKALSPKNFVLSEDEPNPDAILVRSADCHNLEFNKSLKAIARAGVGVNNIPIQRALESGIVVFNTPGANANAVKELVFATMLMEARNLNDAISWTKSLVNSGDEVPSLVEAGKKRFVGSELAGKKLGVIGLGAIGALVANEGYAMGMQVMGYDPMISIEHAWGISRAVERSTSLEEMLPECDYVSIHIPLLKETNNYVSRDFVSKMKRGATLLNFSRGELVDNKAVLEAIAGGQLKRYITDFPTVELIEEQGVVCIPHLGASTPESEVNCAKMAAEQIEDFLTNGNTANSVNLPNCYMPRSGSSRLCIIHANLPNMIGNFTSVLSSAGANITNMMNRSKNEFAYTLIDIDEEHGNDLEKEFGKINGVIRTTILS